jgi:Ca2+/H+ antiporter
MNMENNTKMAITRKGLWLIVMGVLVMVVGFILMMGGGSKDPQVFNEAMFNFRRLTLAPLVILSGIVIIVVAIMKRPKDNSENDK